MASTEELLANGSSGSGQKAWMGCGIDPPGLFHCQAKQRLPHAQWSRHCAVSATPASKSRLKSAFPRPPSAASCGGWEPAEPVRRYERATPGEMIHIDIKKLGRFDKIGHLCVPKTLSRFIE
jgi:hypothetical protein